MTLRESLARPVRLRESIGRLLLSSHRRANLVRSLFVLFGTLTYASVGAGILTTETGCTKEQGQEIKSAVKEGLGFADAICLSGLLDNVNLSDKDRLVACGITDVLNDAAQHYLVQERAQRTESVRRQVAAQMRTQILTTVPCTKALGDGGLSYP